MTDMLIVIPTAGRFGTEKQVTLRNFMRFKMPLPTLIVPSKEAERYRRTVPNVEIQEEPESCKGISDVRGWILSEYARSRGFRYVLMLDDDMDFCYRPVITEPKLETVVDAARMYDLLNKLEGWLKSGFVHVGISARQGNNRPFYDENKNYGLHEYRDATRMMNAYAYDVEALSKIGVEFGRMPVMEDFDLTLQLLRKGYPNRVTFEYCWNQRGSGKVGGCSTYRTAEVQDRAARMLHSFHPDFVKVTVKKNKETSESWKGMKERTDVVVNWRKAFESSGRSL